MNDLLNMAIEAHGGLDRWHQFKAMTAKLSVRGAIFELKQQSGQLDDKIFELDLHAERISISPYTSDHLRTTFVPGKLTLATPDGGVIDARTNPAAAFQGRVLETPWDRFHLAYFASEALWTYLTSPFLYTYPGFITEEIEPWEEDGEVWRRLRVEFPDMIESHNKVQVTHFGPDGLMRRHDYTVDVLGGNRGANYTTDYQEFQGIMIPKKRRIYGRDDAGQKIGEPLLVSIDISSVKLI